MTDSATNMRVTHTPSSVRFDAAEGQLSPAEYRASVFRAARHAERDMLEALAAWQAAHGYERELARYTARASIRWHRDAWSERCAEFAAVCAEAAQPQRRAA